jgi:hypothetical protein
MCAGKQHWGEAGKPSTRLWARGGRLVLMAGSLGRYRRGPGDAAFAWGLLPLMGIKAAEGLHTRQPGDRASFR